MVSIVAKGIDYDNQSDTVFTVPECPACGVPLYESEESDIGTWVKCISCHEKVFLPDEDWLHTYYRQNRGERTVRQSCMKCGGKMEIKQYMRNGKWQTYGGECKDCGFRFIV